MARFIPIMEAVKIAMLGNEDYLQRSRMRLLTWAKYVWEDMNLTTVKVAKRELFKINKRTNSIAIPTDCLKIASVNIVGSNGELYPVYRSLNVANSDIVDIAAGKDCGCGQSHCKSELCGLIKNYEAVVSTKTDKNPDGSDVSFQCVDRKGVVGDTFYEEKQYPLRRYLSGVWVDTILHTERIELCKVEVDSHGCVKDSEENLNAVCNACGINGGDNIPYGGDAMNPPAHGVETWTYFCSTKMDWFAVQCGASNRAMNALSNYYVISELGDRIIFPSNFGFDKVMVRYFTDVNLKDLQIPSIALDTFVLGLKWWDSRFDDKKLPLAQVYGKQYTTSKWGLLLELNKRRISETSMMLTPPVSIPTYEIRKGDNRLSY